MTDIGKPLPSPRAVAERLAEARAIVGLVAFVAVFALLIFVVETLSLLGVPEKILVWMIVVFALAIPMLVAISARTVSLTEFAVAGRQIGAAEDAMAASTGIFGAVFAIGLAAAFFRGETQGSALALGLCGGLLASGVLIAPYLRRAACQSPGDFLARRFGGRAIQGLAGIVMVVALLPTLIAEVSLAATVGSWTLGVTRPTFVTIVLVLMLAPPLTGGMRAVTMSGVLQLLLMLTALVLASIWISLSTTGQFLPLAGYATAAADLAASGVLNPATGDDGSLVGLALAVALGIAVLPTLLLRASATRSTQSARGSLARTLLLVALLALASLSTAALTKWTVVESPGRSGSIAGLVAQPWVVGWVARGEALVMLCGHSASEAGSSCPAGPLQPGAITIDPDIALIAAPQIAGLPPLVGMLVAAGCLAAAVAAGSLTLFGIARGLGHDLLFCAVAPNMPASHRLLAQRLALVAVAALAAWLVAAPPVDYLRLALTGLSLAASGLFPALLAGIWWRRANRAGVLAGMLSGFAIAVYVAVAALYDQRLFAWLEPLGLADGARQLGTEKIALVAVPVGLVVAALASLATRAPDAARRAFAAALFTPRDMPIDDDTE